MSTSDAPGRRAHVVTARALCPGGHTSDVAVSDALGIAAAGVPVVVARLLDHVDALQPVLDLYLEEVARIAGPAASHSVRRAGVERLHEVCTPTQVATLLANLDRRARPMAIPLARRMMRVVAPGIRDRFFVCPRMSMRALVPVDMLDAHPDLLAAGHLGGHLRPVGPHRDVDLTHPRGAVSVWAAVGPVRTGNTVAVTPAGHEVPIAPALDPGDVLLFSTDVTHASVPNHTDETRVGVGLRVVPGRRLRYGPGTHWRPYADARLLETPLAPLATLRSRLTTAAVRRWQWRRRWEREQRREHGTVPPLTAR